MPLSRKCIIPGCDHLQNSSVSLLNKLLEEDSWERQQLSCEWAWFQRHQWTRPQRLRAENTAYFFKILIPYFIYLAVFLAFKFGWVVNNTFFCGVTNSEHTFNIDFTRTLTNWCKVIIPHKQANKLLVQWHSFNSTVMQMLLSCIVTSLRHCVDTHSTLTFWPNRKPTHTQMSEEGFSRVLWETLHLLLSCIVHIHSGSLFSHWLSKNAS